MIYSYFLLLRGWLLHYIKLQQNKYLDHVLKLKSRYLVYKDGFPYNSVIASNYYSIAYVSLILELIFPCMYVLKLLWNIFCQSTL